MATSLRSVLYPTTSNGGVHISPSTTPKNGYKMMIYFKLKHHQPRAPLHVIGSSASACSSVCYSGGQCRRRRATTQRNTSMLNRRRSERPAKMRYSIFIVQENDQFQYSFSGHKNLRSSSPFCLVVVVALNLAING